MGRKPTRRIQHALTMRHPLCFSLLVAVVALCLSGCVTDRTGRSASYLMTTKLETTRARARALEEDLLLERQRIDDMQSRAAASRKRLAESGATLESFLEELQAVRGHLALLRHELDGAGRRDEDMDLRLTELEVMLSDLGQRLGVEPTADTPAEPELVGDEAAPKDPVVAPAQAVEGRTERSSGAAEEAGADEPEPAGDGDVAKPKPIKESDAVVASSSAGAEQAKLGSAVEEIVMQTEGGEPEGPKSPSPGAENSPESALFQAGLLLVKAGSWERAGGRLQQFLRTYPKSKWAPQAMYLVGECLFELGRYKMAITEFQKVIERDGRSPWAPRAMLRQAYAFAALGTADDLEASRIFLAELIRLYPKANEAEEARSRLEKDNADQ